MWKAIAGIWSDPAPDNAAAEDVNDMASSIGQCPKCKSEMAQGFVLDNTYGARVVSHWAPGAPRTSFWTGTKVAEKDLIPIGTFRCPSCGYLEMYARDEFAARSEGS